MKTIIFDFDGTLTKGDNKIWRNIWEKLDALDIDDILFAKYINGELDYDSWCKAIEKEYIKRNFNNKILDELISKIELMDNLENVLSTLKKEGYELRILSGGINYVINNLLKENVKYFSDIRCNHFNFYKKGYLTEIINTDSDEEGKGRYITNYTKETNCNPKDIIFVGNGHNYRFVAQTGCNTICINPTGTNHLDKSIWHQYIDGTSNLADLLPIINNLKKMHE